VSWLQIKFTVTAAFAPELVEALELAGALAVTIEGATDDGALQAALEPTPLWGQNQVIGLFPESIDVADVLAGIRQHLGGTPLPAHRLEALADADWTRAWMSRYRPLPVGRNLWICPSWCTPVDTRAVNIVIDPGMAFGTGAHATTALCLEWLSLQPLTDAMVIDYGCGSGILAIAALKLGARHAYAVDVDPLALIASRENAARNGVAARLSAIPAAEPLSLQADIVLANILAGPLIELAPRLAALVRPGGRIVLTGVLAEQAHEVARRYRADFAFETRQRDEWILLAGTKSYEE